MLAKVHTCSVVGINAIGVEVEVDIDDGLPAYKIVGLPDMACRESQVRVRSAIINSGFYFPSRKITINLAPAELKKEGSSFDLPIAIGILSASNQMPLDPLDDCAFTGELALDGRLRSITGVISRASRFINTNKRFIFPHQNTEEAQLLRGVRLEPAASLKDCIQLLRSTTHQSTKHLDMKSRKSKRKVSRNNFADVKGQVFAKRAMEIACAGGHNIILIGPPGSGKTMLAKRVPSILPSLSWEESIETTKIHSVSGYLNTKKGLMDCPPFRSPHHSISDSALVGGGSYPRPGEISLAHNGVLFLDELPEFKRNVLEVMRQPLEEGRIVVARSSMTLDFPSKFMLVAAMNPCPCGYYTDSNHTCYCTPIQIKNYLGKISGPLMDRIDIHIEVNPLNPNDFENRKYESSDSIRLRVDRARSIQRERYKNESFVLNSQMEGKAIESFCNMSKTAHDFLKTSLEELGFSGRAYHKALKISRTIADLDNSKTIEYKHIVEAIHYRSLDRKKWMNSA